MVRDSASKTLEVHCGQENITKTHVFMLILKSSRLKWGAPPGAAEVYNFAGVPPATLSKAPTNYN